MWGLRPCLCFALPSLLSPVIPLPPHPQVVDFFKLPTNAALALVDEVALDFGQLRLKGKGGAGGHNGLKSLQAHLKTPEYTRLRIGVGGENTKARRAGLAFPFAENGLRAVRVTREPLRAYTKTDTQSWVGQLLIVGWRRRHDGSAAVILLPSLDADEYYVCRERWSSTNADRRFVPA